MMPQAPARQAGLAMGNGRPPAPCTRIVMPQCIYARMVDGLRFDGCDPFRIASTQAHVGAAMV
jgi:hypothetical protein